MAERRGSDRQGALPARHPPALAAPARARDVPGGWRTRRGTRPGRSLEANRCRAAPVALACLVALVGFEPGPGSRTAAATWASRDGGAAAARWSQTAGPPRAALPRGVPFAVGERLTYDVAWSTYVTAGTATATVVEQRPVPGSTAYYIVAEGQPTPLLARLFHLYYRADTLLHAVSLLPERGTILGEEGRTRRLRVTTFERGAGRVRFEQTTTTVVRKVLPVPAETQDALSALYVLRARPLEAGRRLTMPVSDAGALLWVDIVVEGREQVRSGLGALEAWRLVPSIRDAGGSPWTDRRLTVWLSADERRLPLRLQAELPVGTFDLILREVGSAVVP